MTCQFIDQKRATQLPRQSEGRGLLRPRRHTGRSQPGPCTALFPGQPRRMERARRAISPTSRARFRALPGRAPRPPAAQHAAVRGFQGRLARSPAGTLGDEYCERVLMRHLYPQARRNDRSQSRRRDSSRCWSPGRPISWSHRSRAASTSKISPPTAWSISRGRATGRLLEPMMAGAEKAAWCESYRRRRAASSWRGCWGYADSYYDLPFLCRAGASGGRQSRSPPARDRAQPPMADRSFQPRRRARHATARAMRAHGC